MNWTYDPVEDQKSQLSFSAISLEFCSILVKFDKKNLHFTEFLSLLKENLRRNHTLSIILNGKLFLNHCTPPPLDTAIPN